MAECDFCGKEISKSSNKKEIRLNNGNYCDECSNKDLNELFQEILDEEESCEEEN